MKDFALLVHLFLIFVVALKKVSSDHPPTVVRSYPLRGLECFPDDLRLPCDCDMGDCPCCEDAMTGECYKAAWIKWSDWIPCELCNDECDENDECRIKYEEVPEISRWKRSLWEDAGERRRNKRRVPFLKGGPHVNPYWRPMHGRYRCLVLRHECRPAEIDGHRWGGWKPYGPCSSNCEFGTRPEIRDCYNPVGMIVNASHCIGGEEAAMRSIFCNEDLCREYSNWIAEDECYVHYDGDEVMCVKDESRTCIHEPEDVEMRVIEECLTRMVPCDPSECDFTGISGIGNWTEWTTCNCSCKPGWQHRVGVCIFLNNQTASTDCDTLEETEYRRCNTDACHEYTEWAPTTVCTKTCETGILTEERECLDPSVPVTDICTVRLRPCNTETCPVIDYGNFTAWTPCNSTCYVGYQTRMGTCINQTSLEATTGCSDGPTKIFTRMCNTDACLSYGSWGETGECNVTCGTGSQLLTRSCDLWLEGSSMEVNPSCVTNTTTCTERRCVIYGEWGGWSTCSETCEEGTQTRTRQCVYEDDGTPSTDCPGGPVDVDWQLCNTDICDSYSDFEETCEFGSTTCQAYPDEMRRTCNGTGTVIPECLTTPFGCPLNPLAQYDIGIIIDQTHDLDGCKDTLVAAGRSASDIPILSTDPLYNSTYFPNFFRQKQFLSDFFCAWDSIGGNRSRFGVMSSHGDCSNNVWDKLDNLNSEPFINTLQYECGDLVDVVYFAYCHREFQFFEPANGGRTGFKKVAISIVPQLELTTSDFELITLTRPLVFSTLDGDQVHFFVLSSLNYSDSAYDSTRSSILQNYHQFACLNETETSCDYFLGSIYQPIEDVFQKIRDLVN